MHRARDVLICRESRVVHVILRPRRDARSSRCLHRRRAREVHLQGRVAAPGRIRFIRVLRSSNRGNYLRRRTKPIAARPASMNAAVVGSGTAVTEMLSIANSSRLPLPPTSLPVHRRYKNPPAPTEADRLDTESLRTFDQAGVASAVAVEVNDVPKFV